MSNKKDLLNEQGELWARVQEIAFGEDGLQAEDRAEFDKHNTRLDEIEADLNRIIAAEGRQVAEAASRAQMEDLPVIPGGAPIVSEDEARSKEELYSDAFWGYTRNGMESLKADQRTLMESHFDNLEGRAQAVGTGGAGGFTVPEGFINKITEARAAFGGLRNAPITTLSTASGNDIPIPADNDTGNVGELLAENTQVTEQDIVFTQNVLKAYVWSSKLVRVSYQLLQDSAFNLEAWLGKKLGERIGRAQAPYWLTGTGTAQPEGLMTGLTAFTAASATALAWEDFVGVEHAIDPAYRTSPDTGYVIGDGVLKQVRLLKDASDRPLWLPAAVSGIAGGFPATINGFGYTVDVNMPAVATGVAVAAFGDLSYYWIRDIVDVQMIRLNERYADYLQVGFMAWSRSDGRKVDAGDDPIKSITMA